LKDRVLQIDEFLDAVRRVAAGDSAIDPAVVAQLVGRTTTHPNLLATLTDRESAALALIAEGLSNSGIAKRLHLGVRTVETYTAAVFTKLGIHAHAEEHRRVKAVLAYLNGNQP
jgi:DNA-binding NarL/FixJ family response regulator